jgi:hypothetical protein
VRDTAPRRAPQHSAATFDVDQGGRDVCKDEAAALEGCLLQREQV